MDKPPALPFTFPFPTFRYTPATDPYTAPYLRDDPRLPLPYSRPRTDTDPSPVEPNTHPEVLRLQNIISNG